MAKDTLQSQGDSSTNDDNENIKALNSERAMLNTGPDTLASPKIKKPLRLRTVAESKARFILPNL